MSKLQVKTDAMNEIALGAGLVLTEEPTIDATTHEVTIANSSILGATRGGGTFNSNPQSRSVAIDGFAENTKGIHTIDSYKPNLSATFITASLEVLLKGVGFGDIQANKIIARHEVDTSADYADIWWFGKKSDGGGLLIHLMNTSCTNGSAIKMNDKGEMEIPLSLDGNYTPDDQDTVPFEIEEIPAPVTPTPEPTPEPEEPTDNNAQE